MLMGLIGLPISLFLYGLVLRSKKDAPFPKGGLLSLLIAGAVSVALSTVLTMPISAAIAIARTGGLADPAGWLQSVNSDPSVFQEMMASTQDSGPQELFWSFVSMFFGAGLLEEGLKFLTCRFATKREGMIRTWMDSVVCFAIVGITFELIENVAFGAGAPLDITIIRALSPAHFVFGVIMGYFFGKYLVTNDKKYAALSLIIPILYHTVTNVTASIEPTSIPTVISHGIAAIVAVFFILRWQKNKTLDVPVAQPVAGSAPATKAAVGAVAAAGSSTQPKHAEPSAMKAIDEHEYTTYPRRFKGYAWFKPLLVGLLYGLFSIIGLFAVTFVSRLLFGDATTGAAASGYDGMDFYTAAGAFENGATAAIAVPCMLLAARIVHDRPISSYFSSMGGWRWKIFFKSLAAAFVILGIPLIISFILKGKTADVRFTLLGFILLTFFVPFQSLGEELVYRGYIPQTVSSWFMVPLAGMLVQIVAFTAVHPYNIVGLVDMAVSALLYMLLCTTSKGLEAPTAMHIINNMMEIWMTGFGFGAITSEMTVASAAVFLVFKLLFFLFITYANKKLHWFDKVQFDDVAAFNAK